MAARRLRGCHRYRRADHRPRRYGCRKDRRYPGALAVVERAGAHRCAHRGARRADSRGHRGSDHALRPRERLGTGGGRLLQLARVVPGHRWPARHRRRGPQERAPDRARRHQAALASKARRILSDTAAQLEARGPEPLRVVLLQLPCTPGNCRWCGADAYGGGVDRPGLHRRRGARRDAPTACRASDHGDGQGQRGRRGNGGAARRARCPLLTTSARGQAQDRDAQDGVYAMPRLRRPARRGCRPTMARGASAASADRLVGAILPTRRPSHAIDADQDGLLDTRPARPVWVSLANARDGARGDEGGARRHPARPERGGDWLDGVLHDRPDVERDLDRVARPLLARV